MRLQYALILVSFLISQTSFSQGRPRHPIPRGPQELPSETPTRTSRAHPPTEQERLERRQRMLDRQTERQERMRKKDLENEYDLMPDGRAWD